MEDKINKLIPYLPELFNQIAEFMTEKALKRLDHIIPIKNYPIGIKLENLWLNKDFTLEDVIDAVMEVAGVTSEYKYAFYDYCDDEVEYIVFAHAGIVFEVSMTFNGDGVYKKSKIVRLIDHLPDTIYSLKYLLKEYDIKIKEKE